MIRISFGLECFRDFGSHSYNRCVISGVSLLVFVLLAGACSHRAPRPASQKSMDELLYDLSNATDDRVRVAALRQIAKSKDSVALTSLLAALRDDSENVRTVAVESLGEIKSPNASEALLKLAQNPKEGRTVRFTAARALAATGDARAVPLLLRVSPEARAGIVPVIVALGPAAVPPLLAALRVVETRDSASVILAAIGGDSIDGLIQVMNTDEDKYAREAAARTLAEIDDPRAEDALDQAIRHNGDEYAVIAYRYLIRRGQPGSETRLISILNSSRGRRPMAEDFAASGNPVLNAAALEWAKTRGGLAVRSSDLSVVHWDGIDPAIQTLLLLHFDGNLVSTSSVAPAASAGVTFGPGKWGNAAAVEKGGTLRYSLPGHLNLHNGTIEMWISPRLEGSDPIYTRYNHALLLFHSPAAEQFLVSESVSRGFYAGAVVKGRFQGSGGGSIAQWKQGSWHHVAFTYSSKPARARFFVDGVMTAENPGNLPSLSPANGDFTIGCDPYGNWTAFSIDELLTSAGEKSPSSIRADATRTEPFSAR